MNSHKIDDEINILEIFAFIKKNILKIFFPTVLSLILALIYVSNQDHIKPLYKVGTFISPISSFDEFEYKNYNGYIESFSNGNSVKNNSVPEGLKIATYEINSIFEKIDRFLLMDLFIEKLKDDEFLKDVNNKFQSEYKINIAPDENSSNWYLAIVTEDKENIEDFLIFLEKSINFEIQEFLTKNFNQLILNHQRIKTYKIEDIDIKISSFSNNDVIEIKNTLKYLKDIRKVLINDNTEKRLIKSFNSTPIIQSEKFKAVKINLNSLGYKNLNIDKKNIPLIFIIFVLIGITSGIIFALVTNKIRK